MVYKHRIVLILPYFGRFNNYFHLYLQSCKYNSSIDWLIFTDDEREFDFPPNVKVNYTSFEEFANYIQTKFDFNISLSNPYRLCNFRPAYGEIFQDYIQDYDFWGYCDCDLIWGDIRSFITDEILDKYNKIHELGHFSLIRNSIIFNQFYKYNDAYKLAFAEKYELLFFDEHGFNEVFHLKGEDIYRHQSIGDFNPRRYNFQLNKDCTRNENSNPNHIYTWETGNLFRHYITGNRIMTENVLYIHFLKREIKPSLTKSALTYAIIPNAFVGLIGSELTIEFIAKCSKNKFYIDYWFRRLTLSSILSKIHYKIIIEPKGRKVFNKIRSTIQNSIENQEHVKILV